MQIPKPDPTRLPRRLAEIHRGTTVGETIQIRVEHSPLSGVPFEDLAVGAGFEPRIVPATDDTDDTHDLYELERCWSLPDTVGPAMVMLVCGLNPSPDAADSGVGFARPGNRFWPAALAAGVLDRDRDPMAALDDHHIGMTDMVKRTTRKASDLTADEYTVGFARLERLVEWLQPSVICFVGLAGWRSAVDRRAVAGRQRAPMGGRPVYLMGSTSGLNARTSIDEHAAHLRAAYELGARSRTA